MLPIVRDALALEKFTFPKVRLPLPLIPSAIVMFDPEKFTLAAEKFRFPEPPMIVPLNVYVPLPSACVLLLLLMKLLLQVTVLFVFENSDVLLIRNSSNTVRGAVKLFVPLPARVSFL